MALRRIDVHTNLAGVGTQGSGCWASPEFQLRYSFRGLRILFGISDEQMEKSADQDWADVLARLIEGSSEVDAGVALGFDQNHYCSF